MQEDPAGSESSGIASPPAYSVVLPAFNEAGQLESVIDELIEVLPPRAEVVLVDDGSTDDTPRQVEDLCKRHGPLRVIRHRSRMGQSTALLSGIRHARAPWIVTMDADGQNDPHDIPALLEAVGHDADVALVAGLRRRRQDNWSKRWSSRFANAIRRGLLGDGCPDTGCSLKAIRRDVFLELPFFNGMHRFLPALVQIHGYGVTQLWVNHRPRLSGRTKYSNWQRALVGLVDLLGVLWLKHRTTTPRNARPHVKTSDGSPDADRLPLSESRRVGV